MNIPSTSSSDIVSGTNVSDVFVSQEGDGSRNDINCLTQPQIRRCRSLAFVINTVIQEGCTSIESIHIEDPIYFAAQDEIFVPKGVQKRNIHLAILCVHHCVFEGNITFVSREMYPTLHVRFVAVHFIDSKVTVQNVHVEFVSLYFTNSTVQDAEPRAGENGEVWFSSFNVSFFSVHVSVSKTFSSHILFFNAMIEMTEVHILAEYLWFKINNSQLLQSHTEIDVGNYTSVEITNCTVQCSMPGKPVFLLIASKSLKCQLVETSIHDTSGGISVKMKQSFFVSSWLQMHIVGCIFQNITKSSSGGSLSIQYFPSNAKVSIPNLVQITNTRFMENKVLRSQLQSAYGGAVSLVSNSSTDGAQLYVEMHHVEFSDNSASDGGGSLLVSGNFINVIIVNCQFSISTKPQFPLQPLFIFSYSTISILNSSFYAPVVSEITPLNDMQVLSSAQSIQNLTLHVKCPVWHWLDAHSDFGTSSISGETTLQRFTMRCASCPSSFYFHSDGNFSLVYRTQEASVQLFNPYSNSNHLGCIECPYGASCPGNQLNSKPNFWGYKMGAAVLFVQCPSGYCCRGGKDNVCVGYTNCNENREGKLCGACKEDYSLSLLSSKCIHAGKCNDSWIWPVAVLGIVFYMFWYTFKDNILSFPQYFYVKCKLRNQEKPNRDKNVDDGYFGILTYFVQATAMMRTEVEKKSPWILQTFFEGVSMYINLFLTVELKYISHDVCASANMNATSKTRLKFGFYCGIFASWLAVFCLVFLVLKCLLKLSNTYGACKSKMVCGLIEIIKYTYGGFTDVVFYSLTYTSVFGELVWFYDGTMKYFSAWQCEMIAFAVFYIIPFPFVLYLALSLLRQGQISSLAFLSGLFLPLPTLIYWIISRCKITNDKKQNVAFAPHNESAELFERFKGGYKDTGAAPYWESVMILRRLLLGSTAMIPNSFIKLTVCILLCTMFLIHHVIVQPFHHSKSNKAEGLSLFLLCLVALINAYKAMFIHMTVSTHTLDEFMNLLSLLEAVSVPVLLVFIVVMEIRYKYKERKKHTQ